MTAEERMRERAAQQSVGQFKWVEIGFNARLDAEPAPAREPAVEKTGPIDLPISIDGEEWMAYLDYEMLHRDALLKDKEIDRLRAENAALREQLQGGVVVPREPTEAMLVAANIAETSYVQTRIAPYNSDHKFKAIYRAMFAAAKETKHG